MLSCRLIRVPRTQLILRNLVNFCQPNLKSRRYASSTDNPDEYIYITPKRLLKIPYALTVPQLQNNSEASGHLQELDDLFPEVLDTLKHLSPYAEIPEIIDHLKKSLEYTVPYGKRARSLRIMADYKRLTKPENLTPENWKRIKILCWVEEILHAVVLLADDIMDNSELRRGRQTWTKQPGIGMRAVNDLLLFEGFAFTLLKMHWRNQPSYINLIHLLQKSAFFTELGQGYDSTFKDSINGAIKYKNFTMEKFGYCAKYKTMYNAIAPPFVLTLAAANLHDPQIYRNIEPIFNEIGFFFQCLNDFKDLFHDQGEVVTKSERPTLGRDIPTGQLTWFAVKVLEDGNEEQKKTFLQNYGINDPKSVEIIYRIYEEMKLDEVLLEYEQSSFRWLEGQIRNVNDDILPIILRDYVEVLYKQKPNI